MANSYKLDICRWKNNYKLFQPNISRNELTDNSRRFGGNSAEKDLMERYLKAVKDWHYILPPDVMKQIFLDIKKYKKGKRIKKMLEKFVKRITLMDGSESRSKEAILCIPFI